MPDASGPLLFAAFAYPPNALGYCGPADSAALLDYARSGVEDRGLRELARGFTGAWPYLRLIAAANGIDDALDARVVEAYWIGNRLLDRVAPVVLGTSLDERFRRIAGRAWPRIADAVCAGSLPHHNFHVFSVYPWVGMIRLGRVDQPLQVLDRCRIRWGRVTESLRESLVVESRPLLWTGHALALGATRSEHVRCQPDLASAGDWVALHWDWACARLTPAQLGALRTRTLRELESPAPVAEVREAALA